MLEIDYVCTPCPPTDLELYNDTGFTAAVSTLAVCRDVRGWGLTRCVMNEQINLLAGHEEERQNLLHLASAENYMLCSQVSVA